MRIITFALLVLLALSYVKTKDDTDKYIKCRTDNKPKTCKFDDETYEECSEEQDKINDCISDCKDDNDSFANRISCFKSKCKSKREILQDKIDIEIKCHKEAMGSEPNTKPEVTPQPPKPDVKPENKPDTQPENKPETKPENKPVSNPENKPETQPDNKPQTENKPNGNLREDKTNSASISSLSSVYLVYSLGLIVFAILY
ncbi:BibA (macronuclear) [Tetrahymena thermophila SB210]|uniref:BibA n=1 Tax=Tetrahymena thermophila (strain SB210) TaxID=312017 RepID=I7MKY0_TETTS|nr:BibA [Tetrahymena thermophila SB210]EAS00591.1 BibA [Tetrahymena thermophila SB210]|eukprot:XP_001020836.1 BibA [Tetrahymena thermophila SB210]